MFNEEIKEIKGWVFTADLWPLTSDPRSLNPVFIDHDEFKWISLEQLGEFDFAPADMVFVEKLQNGEIATQP
jgi:hypothetical protein